MTVANIIQFRSRSKGHFDTENRPSLLMRDCTSMNRIRLRRIIDLAYEGLLEDREQNVLDQIALLIEQR